jgi:hypothetical protein
MILQSDVGNLAFQNSMSSNYALTGAGLARRETELFCSQGLSTEYGVIG